MQSELDKASVIGDDNAFGRNPGLKRKEAVTKSKSNNSDWNCVCNRMFRPVCGTNGKTYGNSCMAHCAGAEISQSVACLFENIVEIVD